MTPLTLMTATVLGRRQITAGMVRVTLGGEGLADFKTTGVGDEYVRLFFPDPETGELVTPDVDEKGRWRWPEGKTPAHCECYTIRNVREGEIDLDFVVHDHGRASEWAQQAEPGQTIVMRQPYGIYEAPADARWQMFVCDATGLPALGRLLEQLPAGVEARAIVEIPDASHRQTLQTAAELKLVWLEGSGNGLGNSQLPDAVIGMDLPAAETAYVWVATEAKAARKIRRHLRHTLGWAGTRYSVTGYWTDKLAEWEASWKALDEDIKERISELWVSGRDREEVVDEVEKTLEPYGL